MLLARREKKRQFLSGFGKRSRFRRSAANTQQESFKPSPTANAISTNNKSDQVFVCITIGDSKFKVSTTSNLNETHSPNDKTLSSLSILNQQMCNTIEIVSLRNVSREIPLVYHMDPINKSDIPTLLNSGASDHCFANITLFTSYIPFEQPLPGLTAEKGLTFNVEGKGNIELQTYVNGERRTITFENALYTPRFRSNLILIARLSIKGAEAYFKDNKSIIRTKNRTDIISVIYLELLYVVNMDRIQPTAFTAQSKWKPTNFATWHRCLSHTRMETIHQMITENPIDGLNVYRKLSIGGLCKNCIYGKHTAHPYNNSRPREKEVLECIYIDIWGPSQVQSASGILYFMIIIDGFSLYWTVAFLKSKSAEITLKVFKGFYVEVEYQTGKRLK